MKGIQELRERRNTQSARSEASCWTIIRPRSGTRRRRQGRRALRGDRRISTRRSRGIRSCSSSRPTRRSPISAAKERGAASIEKARELRAPAATRSGCAAATTPHERRMDEDPEHDVDHGASEGGYTVQTEVAKSVIEALKAFGGMRAVAEVFTTEPATTSTSRIGRHCGDGRAHRAEHHGHRRGPGLRRPHAVGLQVQLQDRRGADRAPAGQVRSTSRPS
jgi:predicted phage gp36 major capsid-like protein